MSNRVKVEVPAHGVTSKDEELEAIDGLTPRYIDHTGVYQGAQEESSEFRRGKVEEEENEQARAIK
jgi:hypothetical protein